MGLGLSLSSTPSLLFSKGTHLGWSSRFCGPACLSRNTHSPSSTAGPNLNPGCVPLFLGGPVSVSKPRVAGTQTSRLQLRGVLQSCHLLFGEKKRPISLDRCSFWQLSWRRIGQSCSSVGCDASGCSSQGISTLPLRHPLEKRGSDLRKEKRACKAAAMSGPLPQLSRFVWEPEHEGVRSREGALL